MTEGGQVARGNIDFRIFTLLTRSAFSGSIKFLERESKSLLIQRFCRLKSGGQKQSRAEEQNKSECAAQIRCHGDVDFRIKFSASGNFLHSIWIRIWRGE